MTQHELTRIEELERQVNLLTSVAIAQLVALAYLLQLLPIAAVCFIVLIPILAFTHKGIPALARRLGRLFSSVSERPSSSASPAQTASPTPPS